MVESALSSDELWMESRGIPNGLPEWIKSRTGEFAREQRARLEERVRFFDEGY